MITSCRDKLNASVCPANDSLQTVTGHINSKHLAWRLANPLYFRSGAYSPHSQRVPSTGGNEECSRGSGDGRRWLRERFHLGTTLVPRGPRQANRGCWQAPPLGLTVAIGGLRRRV